MCAWGQSDRQDPCLSIAKARNRLAPVFQTGICPSLGSSHFLAPLREARALAASNNPAIEVVKIHMLILL